MHWKLHLHIFRSGTVIATFCYPVLLFIVCLMLQPLGIVRGEVPIRLILQMYEITFPLVAVVLYSYLFAEEQEEKIWLWLPALPLSMTGFFLQRWLLVTVPLLALYLLSWVLLRWLVAPVPVADFIVTVGAPIAFLGNLALFSALIGRSTLAGLAVPLCYWALEVGSLGKVTGPFYLFLGSLGSGVYSLWVNRAVFWIVAVLLWLLSVWRMHRRRNLGVKV